MAMEQWERKMDGVISGKASKVIPIKGNKVA